MARISFLWHTPVLKSTLDDSLTCSLEDFLPDAENRINGYIYQIENQEKFPRSVLDSLGSFLVNKIILREKGIFLPKKVFEGVLHCKRRNIDWILAERLLRDSCSPLAIEAVNRLLPQSSKNSFRDRCLDSLRISKECLVEDPNNYLRRIICTSLSCLMECRRGDEKEWLDAVFNCAVEVSLSTCELYANLKASDGRVSPEQLFSLCPMAVAGTSVVVGIKRLYSHEEPMPTAKIGEIIRKTHVDVLQYFCSSFWSEDKRRSLFALCDRRSLEKRAAYFPCHSDELRRKMNPKYSDAALNGFSIDVFEKPNSFKVEKKNFSSVQTPSLLDSNYKCLCDPVVLHNFQRIYASKHPILRSSYAVENPGQCFLFCDVDDRQLAQMYFSSEQDYDKRKRVTSATINRKRGREI